MTLLVYHEIPGINIKITIVPVNRKLLGLIIKAVYRDIPGPKTTIKIISVNRNLLRQIIKPAYREIPQLNIQNKNYRLLVNFTLLG